MCIPMKKRKLFLSFIAVLLFADGCVVKVHDDDESADEYEYEDQVVYDDDYQQDQCIDYETENVELFGHEESDFSLNGNAEFCECAAKIVGNADTQYDKAMAIYRWECANIAYDVDYKVYSGEECWQKRKGVCQAYSELFVSLAQECGLEAKIVFGLCKNELYPNGDGDHAWVKAKTEKGWILIDPTWGSGTVDGRKFVRSDNDMSWFDVDPSWMIFTHYPEESNDQLLTQPLSSGQYLSLPVLVPNVQAYGFKASSTLDYYQRYPNAGFPYVFDCPNAKGKIFFEEMPLVSELKVGQQYSFRVRCSDNSITPCLRPSTDEKFESWQVADDLYSITISPTQRGTLIFAIKKTKGLMMTFDGVLQYKIVK